MSIVSEIKKNNMRVFRRLYMKRRLAGGDYDTTWQEIPTRYVSKWGSIDYAVDSQKPDFYNYSGANIELTNYDGYFAPQDDNKSFFYNSLTRYKTLVKIEAGYEDASGNEYPTDPTLFIGLINDDLKFNQDAKIKFQCDHLTKILQEIPADRLTFSPTPQNITASQLIEKIRDFQDAGGNYFFRKYITSTSWHYSTTTDVYYIETTSSLQNKSCWELLTQIAGAENKVVYIDRVGEFYFVGKSVVSSALAFHFSGIGDSDRSYGHNIMDRVQVDENIKKVYNRVKIKFDDGDTSTSYYVRNESWQWGDSSSSFMYGVKEYSYDNTFLNASTAGVKAESIYDEYCWPKKEVSLKAKFVPHLMVQDYVTTTYKKDRYIGSALWGYFTWGSATWGERKGYNIELDNFEGKITALKHNIDQFYTEVTIREL